MTDPQPIPIRSFSGHPSRPDGREQVEPSIAWPEALRSLREARGLTQEGWSAHLGVSDVTVRRWERGAAVPTAAAEAALVAWCHENHLFQRYRSGPLAGSALTPELLRELLAEARLVPRPPRTSTPAGAPVLVSRASTSAQPAAAPGESPRGPEPGAPWIAGRGAALPVPATRLIGRETDLVRLCDLLTGGRARLVTLTGPGGAGKTRLGLAAAAALAERFGDRVWFVPLDAIHDPALVLPTIVRALGVDASGNQPLLETAAGVLRGAPALLLIDNFEQVLAAATIISGLLATCAELVILVTSRAALRLRGEYEIPVPPLPAPPETVASGTAGHYPAVQLFLARAAGVHAEFRLTEANANTIARICTRLDGLPLAIELAAVWVKVLTPAALLARLEQATPLLVGRDRDVPARQQTLAAAITWSYDLLDSAEQALFRRVAVFSGGWTLTAAERVASGDGIDAGDVLPLLAQLVDQSLVVADLDGDAPRYRLLETIRQFATARLDASGEAAAVRSRHREWCLAFAAEAGQAGVPGFERLEREHDNLCAALAWQSEEHLRNVDNADTRLQLVAALWRFWQVRGYIAEGRRWLAGALEQAGPVRSLARARALNGAGSLAYYQGDMRAALDNYRSAWEVRTAIGDRRGALAALSNLAVSAYALGELPVANRSWGEALELARQLDDRRNIALALGGLSLMSQSEGEHGQAMAQLEEAHAIWTALDDTLWIGRSLGNMGAVAFYAGDLARARTLCQESVAMARVTGNRRNLAMSLLYLGRTAIRTHDLDTARRCLIESVDVFADLDDQLGIARCLEALGTLACASGRTGHAAHLFGAAERIRVAAGHPLFPHEHAEYEASVASARAAASDAWVAAWNAGQAVSIHDALAAART